MRKQHRIALSAVIALCLLAGFFSLSPLLVRTQEKISLGVAMTPMSLFVFTAQEKGFFEKHGLDMSFKEYGAGVLAADGVLNGEVDMATAAEFLLVRHNLEGDVRLDQHLLRLMEDQSRWLLKRKGKQAIPNHLKHIDWHPLQNIKPDAVGLIH